MIPECHTLPGLIAYVALAASVLLGFVALFSAHSNTVAFLGGYFMLFAGEATIKWWRVRRA